MYPRRSQWYKFIALFLALVSIVLALTACGKKTTYTFDQQRTAAIQFLTQFNQTGSDLGTVDLASTIPEFTSGDRFQVVNSLNTLSVQLQGYKNQIGEMTPPSYIPELSDLKVAEQAAASSLYQALERFQSAIQAGSQAKAQQALIQITHFSGDPGAHLPKEIQDALLSKFNIPDIEVYYRRTSGCHFYSGQ